MESYQLMNTLDESKVSNKYIALKYDAGKIKTEKYGEAILSGHFLLMTRHGEFPPVNVKAVEEKGYIWLKEMGLEQYHHKVVIKDKISSMVAYSTPGAALEKLELYFKIMVFAFLFDDAVIQLKHLNEKNEIKQQKDIIKLVESLVCIIKNHGSDVTTEAAITTLNSIFKDACVALSYTCIYAFKQMNKNDYERLARELMDFIRTNKWAQEYHDSAYTEEDYLFLRLKDVGLNLALEPLYFARDIYVSDEIRMHPLFQKYIEKATMHVLLSNDIFSLRKETFNDERENFVLVKCKKFNLQKSIYKTQKAANEIIFELKKCGLKLKSYFPSDPILKEFVQAIEFAIDGFLYWYKNSRRYGDIKYEICEVKYEDDYDSWVKKVCAINAENMKEPVLSE